MSIINALVDHGHSHESKLFADVIASHNEIVTSLESHNRELLAVIAKKDEALKAAQVALDTYDYTGTKEDSDKYIKAERLCAEAIAFRPGDVELIEVGTVGENYESGDKYLNGIKSLKTGQTVYALQKKEG